MAPSPRVILGAGCPVRTASGPLTGGPRGALVLAEWAVDTDLLQLCQCAQGVPSRFWSPASETKVPAGHTCSLWRLPGLCLSLAAGPLFLGLWLKLQSLLPTCYGWDCRTSCCDLLCDSGFLVVQQAPGPRAPCQWPRVHTEHSREPGKAWVIPRD